MLTRKGQATRDRIVTAAAELMLEQGVAGTTTEQVQSAAGVSASQLYHCFGDKRSLTRAVIQYQIDAVLGFPEPLLARLDSLDAIRSWADAFVDAQRSRDFRAGCPLGSLANELAESDTEARADVAAGYRRWHQAIRAALVAMRDAGKLVRGTDVNRLATTLLTTLQGGLLLAKSLHSSEPLETALNTVIDHVAGFAAE